MTFNAATEVRVHFPSVMLSAASCLISFYVVWDDYSVAKTWATPSRKVFFFLFHCRHLAHSSPWICSHRLSWSTVHWTIVQCESLSLHKVTHFFVAPLSNSGLNLIFEVYRLHTVLHTHTHAVGLLWTRDQLVAEAGTYTTHKKQDRQCTSDVTLRPVRAMVVAVENQ